MKLLTIFKKKMKESTEVKESVLRDSEQNQISPETFADPFKKDCVGDIRMYISKPRWGGKKITFKAKVDLINGGTEAVQSIEAEDFVTLVAKVESFINNLV